MPSRQDELHSYQYSVQRVVAALVSHDPDPQRSPLRRAGATALVSLLVAALAVGGFAAYGLFTGNTMAEATDKSAVLVEKKTGARYVYLESDGKLHPVLNYTSGLLLATGNPPELKTVAAEKLAKVPLGAPLGIPGAPDSLPAAKSLLSGAWSVCTDTSAGRPRSTLLVGTAASGGAAATGGLLVRDTAGRTHLILGSQRFLLPDGQVDPIVRALGWFGYRPWQVSASWVDAIPAGPDLAAPTVPGRGQTSVIDGRKVGRVLTDDGTNLAVVLADGIAPLTEMQAKLLSTEAGGTPLQVGSRFLDLPASKSGLNAAAEGLPTTVPALAEAPATACVTAPGDTVRVNVKIPAGVAPAGTSRVDLIAVTRGAGAVVEAAASPDAAAGSGTVSVITDTGVQYALADRDLLSRLGYASVKPTRIPAQLIAYLPVGPALDPVRAARQ
ncbi:type VII secretion protein EccB [Actinoplanes derwentensis]|uniref:Type VII secretion protein EccB n=1 Tax=Actinoplanes derwentensis TaxID=113562 RepID=A0A1H2CVJ3_9ACTN|nr:type VII secretion protein EccB [Actinoplanes derwentensis]GID81911.1 type VII secretion protein EccB [Actinoplanes derwentensis]SDT74046.1 type VII secretion protein EccB [Actinoplanes derwentensis]